MKFLPFEDARKFVRNLKLKNQVEWNQYLKSGKKPDYIPYKPDRAYHGEWINLGDWLGTGFIHPSKRKYRSFIDARDFVHSLNLESKTQWATYSKSGKLPNTIPSDPRQVYKNQGWVGWGDFLGTGTISPKNRKYMKFEQAREFVRNLRLKNVKEWYRYCKSGKKPEDIPNAPGYIYKNPLAAN